MLTTKFSVFRDQKLVDESAFEKDEILIGAFARADLRIDDEAVERRHLIVRPKESGKGVVENLAGEGRVLLNGKPVAGEAEFKSGDQIEAGPFRMLVTVRAAGEAEGVSGFYERTQADQSIEGGRRALEVAMFWEGALLAVNHYPQLTKITIGEGKGPQYFTPEERIGAPTFDLIVPHNGKFAVNLSNPSFEGDVLIRDKIYTVQELKAGGLLAGGDLLVLDEHTRCRLTSGNIAFLLSYTVLPPKPKAAYFARMSLHEHIYTSVSLIAHILFMIILSLIPEEQLVAQKHAPTKKNRAVAVMKMAAEEKKEDEEKKEEEKKEEEKDEKGDDEGEATEEEKVEEEVVKKKVVTDKKVKTKAKDDQLRSKLTPTKMREHNRQVALKTGVSKVFNQQTDLVQQMMGQGSGLWGGRSRGLKMLMSKGGAPGQAAGGYFSGSGGIDPFGGASGGPGGGGFMGTALSDTMGGAAGGPEDDMGIGKKVGKSIGTKAAFKERQQKVVVTTRGVKVTGGLDKPTIQRYIRGKMGQIRWCYKNELQKNRKLEGKITVEFVIAPSGKVMNAKIAGSTMKNAAVEGCIRQKVSLWRFPASKKGGAARVKYPFIFKAR